MAKSRSIILPLFAILVGSAPLTAQQTGTVAGRVFDSATEQPLSGVAVTVAERSGLSGADGRFIILTVPAGEHTIRATHIGYREETQSVVVQDGQTTTVQLALTPEAIALERLVVIGYGTRRAGDLTGSVETLSTDDFPTGRIISVDEMIQGRVAGLQIVDSGEPGGGIRIRIRGGTSVNASNDPLFVLDGVPLPAGGGLSTGRNPLNFLNPEDIESVTVLKDASATAIYGSRGANGVIIVQTRSGSLREPQFSYSNSLSSSSIVGQPKMLTGDQFREVINHVAPTLLPHLGDASTDWRDAILRSGLGQEHTLAVAGASDNLSYRLSLGYLNQEGISRGSQMERYSAALNASHRLFDDHLNIRAHLRGARTDDQFTPGGGLGAATIFDPTQPIRTAAGFHEQFGFALAPNNPVAELTHALEDGVTYRSIGSIEGEYRLPFLPTVTGTARLGYDVANSERRSFYPSFLWGQQTSANPGYVNRSNPRETSGLLDAFLNYQERFAFANSQLDATAGYSYESSRGDYPFFEAFGLSSDLLGPSGIPVAEEIVTRLSERETKLASFFARANYTINDRYLLTFSVRRDGSSRFGPDNQWGTFPAVAAAWRLSEESFLEGTTWLSDLKLRASWGVNGNQAFGDYQWVPIYRYGDAFTQVQFGNEWITTIRPNAVDPNIKWEETTSYNVGLDYGFLNNRVLGSIEYYRKTTDDLIFRVPVAAGTFLSNWVTTNIGSMRNEGLELTLNAQVIEGRQGAFRWNAGFTASTNRNELLTINPFGEGTDRILVGTISGGVGNNIQLLQPGYSVNTFFVHRHKYGEDGRPVATGGLLAMYEDIDGNGVINVDDRVPLHSPHPTWMLGHTSRIEYGNVSLSYAMRAHLGNYVYNDLASNYGYYNRVLEAAGPINLHRSVSQNHFREAQFYSDVYIEDGSFLKMDNITVGYLLPRFRGLQQAQLFGTVQNAFTLTNYSGIDPEVWDPFGGPGIDRNIYPRSRTFTTGISVMF